MSTKRVVATTLTDLHKEPSFLTELLTQVTNGAELEVLKTDGEWCHVRQLDGYEGWAYRAYLADASEAVTTTHLVCDAALGLFASKECSGVPVTRLPIGMAVRVEEQAGDRARIKLAGNLIPTGWAMTRSPFASRMTAWKLIFCGGWAHEYNVMTKYVKTINALFIIAW